MISAAGSSSGSGAGLGSGASPGPGGFLAVSGLPSPSPSQASSVRGRAPGLPHPRQHPLRPGSSKEDLVRRYVEGRVLHISRRFVKKMGLPEPDDVVVGYTSMTELARDVEDLLNVVWLSGTPSLQIPYLLNVAGELITWIGGFSPAPRAMFSVLRKLDHCFASLLTGADIETGDPLPGFERGLSAGMTRTDMVRCRSLAELTRVAVVEVLNRGDTDPADAVALQYRRDDEGSDDNGHGQAEETGDESQAELSDEDEEAFHMDVAKVYELTLVKLGEVLGDGARIGVFEPMDEDL